MELTEETVVRRGECTIDEAKVQWGLRRPRESRGGLRGGGSTESRRHVQAPGGQASPYLDHAVTVGIGDVRL